MKTFIVKYATAQGTATFERVEGVKIKTDADWLKIVGGGDVPVFAAPKERVLFARLAEDDK